MHVSRNKCELIAECCLKGVEPKVDESTGVTVKGVNIGKFIPLYTYIQRKFIIVCDMNKDSGKQFHNQDVERKYFENATQMFYIILNSNTDVYISNDEIIDLAVQEINQINKYRELEEGM